MVKKALFQFSNRNSDIEIHFKFNLWARHFFPQYFSSRDAYFHREIDIDNIKVYKGDARSFTDIAFRGAAKTARTKLFIAFAISNDTDHFRRYFKVLSADGANSKQIVTDIYNMLIQPEVYVLYKEIFEKTNSKREETMSSFTTSTKIKIIADTVGTDQRGALQEEARPDLIWFEDFENRTTLSSARKGKKIWDNMEEARTSLALGGGCIYTCNYLSEMGNVQKLVEGEDKDNIVLIIPLINDKGEITWGRYNQNEIDYMKAHDIDFEGERCCKPAASKDIYFDRETLDEMKIKTPIKEIAGFKIFKEYDPSHRYAGGGDVAGGVGLDSSTSVFIDFSTVPAQVVGTFHSNTILPEAFGDEMYNEGNIFGGCILAPENNKFEQTVLKIKMLEGKLYECKPKTFGWHTNSLTKSNMLSSLKKAIVDGLIDINDKDVINEVKKYTRNDLIDRDEDIRLTTKHFDFVMACFVRGTMIITNKGSVPIEEISIGDMVMTRAGYKPVVSTMSTLKKVISNVGLKGTEDHPVFYGKNEIKGLALIKEDDKLYIWDSKIQKIERLSFIEAQNIIDIQTHHYEGGKCMQVYNIQVDDCPEYFANNILVHNCAIAWQMKDEAEASKKPEKKMSTEEFFAKKMKKNATEKKPFKMTSY